MLYREDRYENKLSQLGFGCMRFTRSGPSLNYEKAEKEIREKKSTWPPSCLII